MKNLVSILIPAYKTSLSESELISLHQCCQVFSSYPLQLVVPVDLDISEYDTEFRLFNINYLIQRFPNEYFIGIQGYNRLMLSRKFYERFQSYEYILIYQLDAYVFRDELSVWCSKGFDFIGAPLVEYYTDTEFSTHMRVGNGGFSLRKTSTFIHAFDFNKNILSAKEIINRYAVFKKPLTRLVLLFLMILGYRNKLNYFAENWKFNEDDFWSGFLDGTNYPLSKPTADEALEFSFERFPQDAYDFIHKLPFGCHAWEKYEFDKFWKTYIYES